MTEENISYLIEQIANNEIDGSSYIGSFEVDLNKRDKLFDEAARLIVQHQQGSTSLIQRKLNLGYNRAGRLMDQLEAAGIVGPFESSKNRIVLISEISELDEIIKELDEGVYINKKYNIDELKRKYSNEILEKKEEILRKRKEDSEQYERKYIREKLIEKERKKTLEKDVKEQLIKEGLIFNERRKGENSREPIPKEIMNQVWNRDGGACVECGSRENLEFDHIIPVSKGGSTTYRNLQILCQNCNRKKSNKI